MTVADTGVGVPAEDQERIFESFQQGGRGAAREEGTGLGLTPVAAHRRAARGPDVAATARSASGSTFGFAIPARASPDDVGETASGAGPSQIGAVVVIDDDRPSLELLSRVPRRHRWPVTKAAGRRGRAWPPYDGCGRPRSLLDIRLPAWTAGACSGAEVGPGDCGHPGHRRVDRRRARAGRGARRGRVPRQARRSRRPAVDALAGVGALVPAPSPPAPAEEEAP